MVGSSRIKLLPLGDGSSSVSCVPIASKDPSSSSLHLSGSGGGSRLTGGRPRIL
jgi:hypothetical protein